MVNKDEILRNTVHLAVRLLCVALYGYRCNFFVCVCVFFLLCLRVLLPFDGE